MSLHGPTILIAPGFTGAFAAPIVIGENDDRVTIAPLGRNCALEIDPAEFAPVGNLKEIPDDREFGNQSHSTPKPQPFGSFLNEIFLPNYAILELPKLHSKASNKPRTPITRNHSPSPNSARASVGQVRPSASKSVRNTLVGTPLRRAMRLSNP